MQCLPGVVEFLEIPSVLIDLKLFLGEYGTKRAKLLLCDGFKRAKVHYCMGVSRIEVRSWSSRVKASGDGLSDDIDEGQHLIL